MKSTGVVIELPTFKEKEIEGVCEACQFRKQHRHPFPKERNVSKGLLDVVHSDVWGPAQTATFGGMPILRALHRRLLQAHLDLPNAAKERTVQTLPNI